MKKFKSKKRSKNGWREVYIPFKGSAEEGEGRVYGRSTQRK